jgi:hypothetical protein
LVNLLNSKLQLAFLESESLVETFNNYYLRLKTKVDNYRDAKITLFYDFELNSQIALIKIFADRKKLYFNDKSKHLSNFEVILSMRVYELTDAAIKLLNENSIVAAALIARSLLELTIFGFEDISQFNELTGDLGGFDDKKMKELNMLENKMLWSSKYASKDETYLKPRQITESIRKIEQKMSWKIKDKYTWLCEFAHPNRLGYDVYIERTDSKNNDGSITYIANKTKDIIDKIEDTIKNNLKFYAMGPEEILRYPSIIRQLIDVVLSSLATLEIINETSGKIRTNINVFFSNNGTL